MKFFNFLKILSNELRSGVHLPSRNSSTVFFGIESIMNPGANLWKMVPQNIKTFESLNVFKSKIKYSTSNHCPCRICKTCIGQADFINEICVFAESTISLIYFF